MKVSEALELWQKDGLLTAEKVKELILGLKKHEKAERTDKGVVIFSTIGACLIGLGILLFIGSNWSEMGPAQRIITLFVGYLVVGLAAITAGKRGLPKVEESLWFLLTVMYGANIFLLGQIFNFTLTFWQGPFLWLIGALVMGYARQKLVYGVVAIPLALLALGWYGGGSGWFMDDQMEFLISGEGLRALLPLIGITLIALSRGMQEWKITKFLAGPSLIWGMLLFAVPIVITTIHQEVLSGLFDLSYSTKQIVIILIGIVSTGVMVFTPYIRTKIGRATILAMLALTVVLLIEGDKGTYIGDLAKENGFIYGLYVLFIFLISISSVWVGLLVQNRNLVNAGIACSSVIILIQYFSWSFEMLPNSIAFILGGVVLIGLSIAMERTRRALITSMNK